MRWQAIAYRLAFAACAVHYGFVGVILWQQSNWAGFASMVFAVLFCMYHLVFFEDMPPIPRDRRPGPTDLDGFF